MLSRSLSCYLLSLAINNVKEAATANKLTNENANIGTV